MSQISKLFQTRGMYIPFSKLVLSKSQLALYNGFRTIKKGDIEAVKNISITSPFERNEYTDCAMDIKAQPVNLFNIGWSVLGLRIGIPMLLPGIMTVVSGIPVFITCVSEGSGIGALMGIGLTASGSALTVVGTGVSLKSIEVLRNEVISGWKDHDLIIDIIDKKSLEGKAIRIVPDESINK